MIYKYVNCDILNIVEKTVSIHFCSHLEFSWSGRVIVLFVPVVSMEINEALVLEWSNISLTPPATTSVHPLHHPSGF